MRETAVWISRRSFVLGALAAGGCGIIGGGANGGFGTAISIPIADVDAALTEKPFMYVPEGRLYVVAVADGLKDPLKDVTDHGEHAGIDAGYAALYQKCPHLGCRVPECAASGQFECPCHGAIFGPLGDKRGGPSPRGMDRFVVSVANDELIVDTARLSHGLPVGVELGPEPLGPNCIEPGDPEA